MKAKAPEKIYLKPLLMEDGESIVRRCTFERQRDSQIEYILTDAFIDVAWEWLRFNRWKYEDSREGNEAMEKDFRKAMKGE